MLIPSLFSADMRYPWEMKGEINPRYNNNMMIEMTGLNVRPLT